MVQWPGQLPQEVVEERPVLSLDIAATALGVGGAETPGNLDGVNLLPYLRDTTSGRPHEELFCRQGTRMAVRAGDWKLLRNDWRNPDAWELYDLASDPTETKNLLANQPDRAASLKRIVERFDGDMKEPAF